MRKHLIALVALTASVSTIAAESSYVVNGVEFRNLREIPQEVVLSKMSLKEGEVFSAQKLQQDYKNLKASGYFDQVTISPKMGKDGVRLVVEVREKPDADELLHSKGITPMSERDETAIPIKVADVQIVGASRAPVAEILKKVPLNRGGQFSKNKVIKGQRAIIESGYFKEVKPDVYQNNQGLVVVYTVVENPIVKNIEIDGNTKYTDEELEKLINITPGKMLNINDLRAAREKVDKKYKDDGYVLADISDVDVTPDNTLKLTIREGVVNNVTYSKMITKQKGKRREANDVNLKTKDYVIQRELALNSGEVFNINDYNKTVSNLMRTGAFKNVKYQAVPSKDDPNKVDINLLLEEERTASLQGAVSYGSEVGLMGSLALKDTNWKGKAQEVSFNFEKSDDDYTSFSLDFSDPWIKDTDRISWGWSLYKNDYGNDDSVLFNETDTYGVKVHAGKGLNDKVRVSLGTKAEYIKEKARSDFGAYPQAFQDKWGKKRDYWLYSVFPSISYDTRNSFWNPTEGFYGKYQIEAGYADATDSGAFANTTLELRKYHRGFFKKNTFAYRLVGGIMTDTTPESQRFWVGGGSTLRGYDGGYYQGTKKITGTIENRTQINDVLGVVLFSDIGRAWDYKGDDPGYLSEGRDAKMPDNIATTAGVGLRVNTPVGPLRFDFGWPIGDKEEKGMKFYFNMGQSF